MLATLFAAAVSSNLTVYEVALRGGFPGAVLLSLLFMLLPNNESLRRDDW